MVQGFQKAQSEYEAKMANPYEMYNGEEYNVNIIVKINIDNQCNAELVTKLIEEKIAEVNYAEFIDFDE